MTHKYIIESELLRKNIYYNTIYLITVVKTFYSTKLKTTNCLTNGNKGENI